MALSRTALGRLLRADDVVEQQLAGGAPEHTGAAVHDEEHRRVPHLQRVGQEQQPQASEHAMNSSMPIWIRRRGS